MAITITGTPTGLTGGTTKICLGYNPIVYTATSNNHTLANFKYVWNVYVNATSDDINDLNNHDGTLAATLKFIPLLDGSCKVDISRIVQDYLSYSYEEHDSVSASTSLSGTYTRIYCQYGEDVNGTITNTGYTTDNITVINAVMDVDDFLNGDTLFWEKYITQRTLGTEPGRYWMSHDSLTTRNTFPSELAWGYFWCKNLEIKSHSPLVAIYRIYQAGDVLRTTEYLNIYTGSTIGTDTGLSRIPVGMGNIPFTFDDDDEYYTISLVSSGDYRTYNTYRFNIKECKRIYPWMCLYFLRKNGSMMYLYFKLNHKKKLSVERKSYEKILSYNYDKYDRGTSIYSASSRYGYELLSDWMNNTEIGLYEELVQSPVVYMLQYDSVYTAPSIKPVVITDTDVQIKDTRYDNMVQYTINVIESNKNKINI